MVTFQFVAGLDPNGLPVVTLTKANDGQGGTQRLVASSYELNMITDGFGLDAQFRLESVGNSVETLIFNRSQILPAQADNATAFSFLVGLGFGSNTSINTSAGGGTGINPAFDYRRGYTAKTGISTASFVPLLGQVSTAKGEYGWRSAGAAIQVSSLVAADNVAGTGLQQMRVDFIKLDGGNYTLASEVIDMNGTTAVTVPNSADAVRIIGFTPLRSGSFIAQNAGPIRANIRTVLVDTLVMPASTDIRVIYGAIHVPKGKKAIITSISGTCSGGGAFNGMQILLFKTAITLSPVLPYVFSTLPAWSVGAGNFTINLTSPIELPEMSDGEFVARAVGGTGDIALHFDYYYADL